MLPIARWACRRRCVRMGRSIDGAAHPRRPIVSSRPTSTSSSPGSRGRCRPPWRRTATATRCSCRTMLQATPVGRRPVLRDLMGARPAVICAAARRRRPRRLARARLSPRRGTHAAAGAVTDSGPTTRGSRIGPYTAAAISLRGRRASHRHQPPRAGAGSHRMAETPEGAVDGGQAPDFGREVWARARPATPPARFGRLSSRRGRNDARIHAPASTPGALRRIRASARTPPRREPRRDGPDRAGRPPRA